MGDETVNFLKRARVHQQLQPLPGGFLAALVLLVDATLPSAQSGLLFQLMQPFQAGVGGQFGR